jgi:hypothetical protein
MSGQCLGRVEMATETLFAGDQIVDGAVTVTTHGNRALQLLASKPFSEPAI